MHISIMNPNSSVAILNRRRHL